MPVPSPTTRVQPFLLRGYHGEPTRGSVTIHEFDREHRVRRAVAGLGKWWGVGLLTVLIPVAHFVLVPSFIAYGLWQFFQGLARWSSPPTRAAPVPTVAPSSDSIWRPDGAHRSR